MKMNSSGHQKHSTTEAYAYLGVLRGALLEGEAPSDLDDILQQHMAKKEKNRRDRVNKANRITKHVQTLPLARTSLRGMRVFFEPEVPVQYHELAVDELLHPTNDRSEALIKSLTRHGSMGLFSLNKKQGFLCCMLRHCLS